MKNDFYTYLLNNRKALHTATTYHNQALAFEAWAESEDIKKPQRATYTELLAYIDYCRSLGNAQHTITQKNIILKHYFTFCKHPKNPAIEINLKGVTKKLPKAALTTKELTHIYNSYNPPNITGQRNKIIIGIVIYQGVGSKELENIETTDINLKKGTIYIPGALKTNSRTLELKAFQLLDMQNYLLKIRPELMQQKGLSDDETSQNTQLFVTTGHSKKLGNAISIVLKHLRKTEPKLKDFQHIRTSVITHWVKQHGLRKAQYMAGHRYVSSTERYQTDYLEDLKNQLDIYHPF